MKYIDMLMNLCVNKWYNVYISHYNLAHANVRVSLRVYIGCIVVVKLIFEMLIVCGQHFQLTDGCPCESVEVLDM